LYQRKTKTCDSKPHLEVAISLKFFQQPEATSNTCAKDPRENK